MKTYAERQASALLRRLGTAARKAEERATAKSIHDLRTGIRRMSECLRTFGIFFPDGEARGLRRKLKELMDLAGEVRDRDVAGKLLRKAGLQPGSGLLLKLARQRGQARAAVKAKLDEWRVSDFSRHCRAKLNL